MVEIDRDLPNIVRVRFELVLARLRRGKAPRPKISVVIAGVRGLKKLALPISRRGNGKAGEQVGAGPVRGKPRESRVARVSQRLIEVKILLQNVRFANPVGVDEPKPFGVVPLDFGVGERDGRGVDEKPSAQRFFGSRTLDEPVGQNEPAEIDDRRVPDDRHGARRLVRVDRNRLGPERDDRERPFVARNLNRDLVERGLIGNRIGGVGRSQHDQIAFRGIGGARDRRFQLVDAQLARLDLDKIDPGLRLRKPEFRIGLANRRVLGGRYREQLPLFERFEPGFPRLRWLALIPFCSERAQ